MEKEEEWRQETGKEKEKVIEMNWLVFVDIELIHILYIQASECD